jgi:methionyl-tRNA formyltransferase
VRTVFLGTSDFAATVLARLAAGDHRPALVVSPPDRRRGRGRRLASPPVAELARELGIELLQTDATESPRALERIRAAAPEAGVVCAFGQLIREPLLSELVLLNVHPSLLPRWRGAAPIERAIMAGDEQTGVTIMRLGEGLDSGPIALAEAAPIAAGDDHATLSARLAERGAELLARALDMQAAGELELAEQDDSRATYAEKIDPAERRLDPARPAPELERAVRALHPHVGTYLELAGGERLGVVGAAVEPEGPPPGQVSDEDGLVVGTGEGGLRLLELRPAGGKAMSADAYRRGHPVPKLA